VDEISQAISKILENDTNYKNKLIKKGFLQAKKFTWENAAKKTINLYEDVYANRLKRS